MPLYCAVTDLEVTISKEAVKDLSDDIGLGQADTTICNGAIDRAETVIHSYLVNGGYSVPVTTPLTAGNGVLKTISIWLAIGELASRRGVIPEEWQRQIDKYMKMLEAIAAGDIKLEATESSLSLPQSSTLNDEKRFTVTRYDHDGEVINDEESGSLDIA